MKSISEFFAGQTVFITGGTGFIGKVLVEKMLRSCPDVKEIYLAMREKKGVPADKRWADATNIPLFEGLKEKNPDAMKKIRIIGADMKEPRLGISEDDKHDIIKNVTIVYHVAATVQFADNIIDTLKQNTRATLLMVELAKQIENLKVFVYVSTTYTNFFRPESQWDEKLYPPVQDWRIILRLVETEPLQLARIKERLLCGHPNPYTFSKSLAEQVVADNCKHIKAVIVRPSVVMPALDEPLKGWVDSLNGMAALCISNGLGVLRVARHSDEAHQDYIPVDAVAKFLFVAAWHTAQREILEGEQNPPVYNCTTGKLLTIKTSDISRITAKSNFIEECPSKYIVWTRDLKLVKNKYKFQVQFFLEQVFPACVLDAAIYLYGREPLFLKIAKKLAYANQILFKDFQFSKVHFQNTDCVKLMRELKGEDRERFGVEQMLDMSLIKLEVVLRDVYFGVLKYFFKEDLSEKSIARNKRRYQRILLIKKMVQAVFYSSLLYFLYRIVQEYKLLEMYNELFGLDT